MLQRKGLWGPLGEIGVFKIVPLPSYEFYYILLFIKLSIEGSRKVDISTETGSFPSTAAVGLEQSIFNQGKESETGK